MSSKLISPRVPEGTTDLHLMTAWTRYSTWSARVVIVFEYFQIPYSMLSINLTPPSGIRNKPPTPAGLVPALKVTSLDGIMIHDSLAILEFLAEKFPDKALWPRSRKLRALARAVANEMHAGFGALRANYSANYVGRYGAGVPVAVDGLEKDLARLCELWEAARVATRGELGAAGDAGFLFGEFGIADAMYWPVLWRIRTYGLPIKPGPEAKKWINTMWNDPRVELIENDMFAQAADPETVILATERIYGDAVEYSFFEKGWKPEL